MNDQITRTTYAERIWSGEITSSTSVTEDGIALVTRFFEEVWNKGNLGLMDELLTADFVDHNQMPGAPRGPKGYKAFLSVFRSAFPDLHLDLEQVFAEGDRIAVRLSAHGTHQGSFMGIPATGKQVSIGSMIFFALRDGKLAERWGILDLPGLMQQLGVQGPPAQSTPAKGPYDHVSYMGPKDSKSTTRVLNTINLAKATKEDTRGIYSLFVSTVQPGDSVPIHTHLKEDEAYYLLSGEWELYDVTNKETLRLGPENYVYVPMGITHGFKNVGSTTARLVLIITPGGLEGFFEGIGQVFDDPDNPPPAPTGPYDFAKAAEVAARYNITFIPPSEQG